ncbi:MAG: glycosyltransferase family 9 protein [Candidatus Zixiibacteriota bacterium]|nr:MAG: glycosyltransferase family 9 protein [candidate division Zixibacteria bacterium]
MAVLERVLIIRNQGIGDLLLITPALRAVRALHPEARVALVVGEWSRPAVEGNPNLDEIIAYPDAWIQNKQPLGYLRLVAKLARRRFHRAYIFHSHTLIHLIAALAGIPRRYGFFDPGLGKSGALLTAKAKWQPNTDRYIADNYLDVPRLAGFSGSDVSLDLCLSPEEQAAADDLLARHGLEGGRFFTVAPGGGINPRQNVFAKRWGTERFSAFCRLLLGRYGLPVVLLGSRGEMEISRAVAAGVGERVVDLTGRVPFRTSAGLIRRSRMLISNDSSVMHVAVAYRVPSLALFGPSNPRSLLPDSRLNQWITSGVDCQPCYCNSLFTGCEHLRCMTQLAPETALARVEAMLTQTETRTG